MRLIITALVNFSSFAFAGQISVRGECQRRVVPDIIQISFVAEARHKDSRLASEEASRAYEAIHRKIDKNKALTFTTTEMSLQPESDWSSGKRIDRGFVARYGLQIQSSEREQIEKIMLLLREAKNIQITGPQTLLSTKLYRESYESCLEEALQHAQNKAQKLLSSVGKRLGKLHSVNEQAGSSFPQPMAMIAKEAPSIEMGQDEIQVSLIAEFNID